MKFHSTKMLIKASVVLFMLFWAMNLNAQTLELLGPRYMGNEQYGWDFPTPDILYEDDSARLYVKVFEGSPGRSPELIRYDFKEANWEDLFMGSVNVGAGESASGSIGKPDGSYISIMRSFNSNIYVYQAYPDATWDFIGSNPIISFGENLDCGIVQNSKGDLYAASATFGSIFQHYNGVQWQTLESFTSLASLDMRMDIDSNDHVYVTHQEDFNTVMIDKWDGMNWTRIFTGIPFSEYPDIQVVAPDDIYLVYKALDQTFNAVWRVFHYDGSIWTNLGGDLLVMNSDSEGKASLFKSSFGELFLATTDEDGFKRYNAGNNNWEVVPFSNSFSGRLSGFACELFEMSDHSIINAFFEDIVGTSNSGLTILRYTPDILSAGFTSDEQQVCAGSQVQFTDMTIGSPESWEWTFEGGSPAMSTNQNPVVVYDTAGSFNVQLIVFSNNKSDTLLINDFISAEDLPEPFILGADTVCKEEISTYEVSSQTGNSYLWTVENGTITSGNGTNEITVYWPEAGSGTVGVTETTAAGCEGVSSLFGVDVQICTNIDKLMDLNLKIYPNPATDVLHLDFSLQDKSTTALLTDLTGRALKTFVLTGHQNQFWIGDIPAGIYLIRIYSDNKTFVRRIVIE